MMLKVLCAAHLQCSKLSKFVVISCLITSHDQGVGIAEGAQSGSPYQTQPLSTLEPNPYEGKPGRKPSAEVQSNYFKLRLMECIAGLDRGFAANSYAAMQVESAALALTEQSQPVNLSWTAGESLLIALGCM